MNTSYVRNNYLYRATSLLKNTTYPKARKENYTNGSHSTTPTIYPFGMNTQGGFCDFAVLSLKQMAKKKFLQSFATKRKLDWLKAQWVNETCRDLQAKVIKTAAFCHNRALQDLFLDSCSQQDFPLWQLHRCRVIPTSSAFNEYARKDRNLLVLCGVLGISLQTCIRASL